MNTPDHRDANLAAWLEHSGSSTGPSTPGCPDAETMAAWVDGGLEGAVRLQVQTHVAACSRCRAVAGALGRADAVPATIDVERAGQWWRGWVRWAIPLTAAATAVVALAVWVRTPAPAQPPGGARATETSASPMSPADGSTPRAVAEPQPSPTSATPEAESRERTSPTTTDRMLRAAPGGAAPVSAGTAPVGAAPGGTAPGGAAPGGAAPGGAASAAAAPAGTQALNERADARPSQPSTTSAVSREQPIPPVRAAGRAAPGAPAASAAAPAQAPAAPQTLKEPIAVAGSQAADSQVQAKAERPEPAANARAAVAAPPAVLAEQLQGASGARPDGAWTTVAAPGGTARWRFSGSQVQASSDGGATWRPVPIGDATNLRAGSAVNAAVCWIVGRGGLVVRTLDGSAWTRMPFPETADLVAVRATSQDAAQVTTAAGRVYVTTDSGRTWRTP